MAGDGKVFDIFMDGPEFTGDDEIFAARSIHNSLECVRDHVGYEPCGKVVQTGPLRWGVLAFNVCGLRPGHNGHHRAGWTGTGELYA